mgnify:CR=1 FL=1
MKTKKGLILSLDKFITESLYKKNTGYYMSKNPFGKKGDFITAPNISILFSEMIAIWIIAFWQNLKTPKKINLVEMGAGNAEDILDLVLSPMNYGNVQMQGVDFGLTRFIRESCQCF